MRRPRRQRYRGQATAEVVIGLIGLTALFFGVIQVAWLGRASVRNLMDAREDADEVASQTGALGGGGGFIQNWESGSDALRFSADDVIDDDGNESLGTLTDELAGPFPVDQVPIYGGNDGFTPRSSSVVSEADLNQGESTRTVGVQPAVRILMNIQQGSIRLEDEVYMPDLEIFQGSP